MNRAHDNLPEEFEGIASLLEQERAELSALELDRVKRRVLSRAAGTGRTHSKKGSFMKSRLAIIATVAIGLLMSGTGATLALDGLSTTRDASVAQYGGKVPPPDEGVRGGGGSTSGGGGVQPARQVEVGTSAPTSGELPFTGYAGITVLLIGLALLATGLVLRRRTQAE